MSEIKFRVWNKMARRFWQWDDLNAYNIVALSKGADPNFELSQYTGLVDRKGKEIYEGDIVLGMVTGNYPALIEKDAPNGGYNIRERDGNYIEIDSNIRIEVIGNVYETPEYY